MASATGRLDGTSWVSRGLVGSGTRFDVTLAFEGDRCSGSSGCNRFMGPARVEQGSIALGPLAGTMMACEPPVMDAEAAVLARLGSVTRWTIQDGSLVLEAGDETRAMVFEPAPTGLGGVRWVATAINNGRGAVASVVPGPEVDAVFGDNETVSGRAGCNRYTGPWSLIGAMLAVGPIAMTRMACPDAALMAQESAYARALERATGYRRDLDRLELRDADGALMVAFEAAAEG